ncbi:ArsC family reductase [Ketobacter alkanivorans]|uniref:ArsC family reductase n=1 Tax=Ketobacter alkanivorans TaxID=1917421 RepID=A0A2K9LLR1_9GAMM|nr:ArsC family reductase [Ketobacter alkanivorans]AUM11744.1 ArsC family reductase [Ketobacter alkanivorans]
MTTTLYGIPNCDTVKKARKWLDANGIEYRFHDFRKDGINESMIREWMKTQPLEILLNKRGTTWRQLPDDVKDSVDERCAVQLMVEHPAMIKRPVMVSGNNTSVGFKDQDFQAFFGL